MGDIPYKCRTDCGTDNIVIVTIKAVAGAGGLASAHVYGRLVVHFFGNS